MTMRILATLVGCAAVCQSAAAGGITYDESLDGDLSDDRLSPTSVAFGAGLNTLHSDSVSGDRDYFTFNVPAGLELASITLASYDQDGPSFIAVQSGTQLTEPPTGTNPGNLLGWVHFGSSELGTDILDDMGAEGTAIGFASPLPSGDYTFWSQETGPTLTSYTLVFELVPAPGTLALAGLMGAGLVRRPRRSA